jgi:hypothetical protein
MTIRESPDHLGPAPGRLEQPFHRVVGLQLDPVLRRIGADGRTLWEEKVSALD